MNKYFQYILVLLALGVASPSLLAAELRPFTLALTSNNSMGRINEAVLESLKNNGFEILGDYRPEPDVTIYIITSKELKRVAAKTQFGAFGAAIHVSVTRVINQEGKEEIQVAYNNPSYMALAYNMDDSLKSTKDNLARALGAERDFGGAVDEERLPTYNYTFGLEGFTGFIELGNHADYRTAIRKVEAGLKNNKFGISQVFRIDIPGKNMSLFGLSLKSKVEDYPFINDANVMKIIDYQQPRRSAHLPYEVLVTEGRVIAMHAHFRIAINFPDLKMFGNNGFGRLIQLPYDFEEFFTKATGGQWPPVENW
ncbi:MAG: hypothetical protein OEY89_04550 [Gammaproteobacteria bacterium]|nr:hypothetical protein [Gammaproteobacteria bacterium]